MPRTRPARFRICVTLLTLKRFDALTPLKELLRILEDVAPDLIAEKIGFTEPLKHEYSADFFSHHEHLPFTIVAFSRKGRERVRGTFGPSVFNEFGELY